MENSSNKPKIGDWVYHQGWISHKNELPEPVKLVGNVGRRYQFARLNGIAFDTNELDEYWVIAKNPQTAN